MFLKPNPLAVRAYRRIVELYLGIVNLRQCSTSEADSEL
jgi:hypothetical protein